MSSSNAIHVIIIGAGPAGLASAVCLQHAGISFTIIEQGATSYAAMKRIDPDMILLSPVSLSKLPWMNIRNSHNKYVSFSEYLSILQEYQDDNGIDVHTNCKVVNMQKVNGMFVVYVQDSAGITSTLSGTHVINATGMSSHKHFPENFEPTATNLPWKHSIDVRAHDLHGVHNLVVVGGGNSAFEILKQWSRNRSNQDHAWLSTTSKIRFVQNPILGIDIHYIIWLPEHISVFRGRDFLYNLSEPIIGRELLPAFTDGYITQEPVITSFEKESVVFDNGNSVQPDFVVFATGFTYKLDHVTKLISEDTNGHPLVHDCESSATPGLFILGLRFGRTFASQFIRGIARDAKFITQKILNDASRYDESRIH